MATYSYKVSHGTQTWSNVIVGDSILPKNTTVSKMKRAVAAPRFHGRDKSKFDVVMLENSNDVDSVGKADNFVPVWFSRSLRFIKISKTLRPLLWKEELILKAQKCSKEKRKVVTMNTVSCSILKFWTKESWN